MAQSASPSLKQRPASLSFSVIDWSTLPVAVSPESRRPDACATSTPAIPANASTAATTSNPRLGRRRTGGAARLGPQGGRGPSGVVVPQDEVVVVVEVAGFVLALEVLQGAQQEVALVGRVAHRSTISIAQRLVDEHPVVVGG